GRHRTVPRRLQWRPRGTASLRGAGRLGGEPSWPASPTPARLEQEAGIQPGVAGPRGKRGSEAAAPGGDAPAREEKADSAEGTDREQFGGQLPEDARSVARTQALTAR